jgi:hypothetical protein
MPSFLTSSVRIALVVENSSATLSVLSSSMVLNFLSVAIAYFGSAMEPLTPATAHLTKARMTSACAAAQSGFTITELPNVLSPQSA